MQFVIRCDCAQKDDCEYVQRITEAIEYLEDDYPSIVDFDDIIIVDSEEFFWDGRISDNDYSCLLSCGVLKEASDDHLIWIMKRLYFDTELNNRDDIDDDEDDEYSENDENEGDDMTNLERVLARLNESKEIDYPIEVINSAEINGYATSDGKIKITSAAVENLSEGEIAFIISHEESHLDRKHKQKKVDLINSAGETAEGIMKDKNTGLFKRILGVAAVAAVSIGVAPLVSKGHEIEADIDAKKRMLDAGYSEGDISRFLEQHETSDGRYFSSHPTSHTRRKMLK